MGKHINTPKPSCYAVGYKKPPKETQFKKGQSGNPKGRKKGSKNNRYKTLPYELPPEMFSQAILDEAYREIAVNENGGQIKIPTHQAIIRSLFLKAAKGNIGALRLATELIAREEKKNLREGEDRLTWILDYKSYWEKKLANGYSGPIDGPHLDHIKVNMQTGRTEIIGPISKQEREENDRFR